MFFLHSAFHRFSDLLPWESSRSLLKYRARGNYQTSFELPATLPQTSTSIEAETRNGPQRGCWFPNPATLTTELLSKDTHTLYILVSAFFCLLAA